jgi:hypothetical protein
MKDTYQKILYTLLLVTSAYTAAAQEEQPLEKAAPIFTADSLVSGNTKDVLTKFFQLAFNNLTGDNKEFNFNSNPFAVMLKSNPRLNIDHYYSKYNALRKLNFGFGIRLDTAYRFNGFSSGVKYALIDQRDYTTSRLFAVGLQVNGFAAERKALNAGLRDFAQARFLASARTDADRKERNDFLATVSTFFNKEIPFNSLDAAFQKTVMDIVQEKNLVNINNLLTTEPGSSLKTNDMKVFESLKDSIKNCALWIIGISDTTYRDQFAFSNVVLNTEFSKGIFKPRPGANNIELNLRATGNFLRDTLRQGNNLRRFVFDAEAGFNWVIRDKYNQRPMFEFKASTTYYHNFTSLYQDEDRDRLTLNGTARIRVFEDIWVPLEFRYDPSNGNVFGFLNVKANFTGLGKLVKEMAK